MVGFQLIRQLKHTELRQQRDWEDLESSSYLRSSELHQLTHREKDDHGADRKEREWILEAANLR
jgi:hypothetical protein